MALRPENRSSGLLAQVRPAGAIGPREGPGYPLERLHPEILLLHLSLLGRAESSKELQVLSPLGLITCGLQAVRGSTSARIAGL